MTTLEQIRWVPVSIELPDPHVVVLIDSPTGVSIGSYHSDGSWLDLCTNDAKPVVSHWAKMPSGAKP